MRPNALTNAHAVRRDGNERSFKRATHGTTLVDVTLESIVDTAITRVYPERALPSSDDLVKQIGVSRNVVRQAVSHLVARGILESRTNLGTWVVDERQWKVVNPDVLRWRQIRGTDPNLPGDILEFRRWIEPSVAANAAANAIDNARARVIAACEARLARPSPTLYLAARRELHVAIFDACQNQIARQFDCLVDDTTWPLLLQTAAIVDRPAEELHAVMALADAFNAHQPEAAYDAMVELLKWDLETSEQHDA